MINELKKQIRLIKYGFNMKSSIVVAVIFVVMGVFFSFHLMDADGFLLAGFYIILGPTMMIQVQQSLLVSNLVAASPKKKALQTWIPDILQLILSTVVYLLLVIFAVWQNFSTHGAGDYAKNLMYLGILAGILLIYYGAAYKSFLFSVIFFTIAFSIFYTNGILSDWFSINLSVDMAGAALLGLLFIFVGNLLSGVLRRVLYKKPLSKYAMGVQLRKYM